MNKLKNIKNINKALLLPIAAMVAGLIKVTFDIQVSDVAIDKTIDGVLALIAVAGIFMEPTAPEKKGGKKS